MHASIIILSLTASDGAIWAGLITAVLASVGGIIIGIIGALKGSAAQGTADTANAKADHNATISLQHTNQIHDLAIAQPPPTSSIPTIQSLTKLITVLLLGTFAFITSGCVSNSSIPTTQSSSPPQFSTIINPLTGQPLTVADVQTANAEITALLNLANSAGLSNQDVAAAKVAASIVTTAATTLAFRQATGLPPDQQVLSDAATAIAAYKAVKSSIATHPVVQAATTKPAK